MANILNINDLPPEKLPDFWNDNARINSLYAPFRDRSVNARDWDAKLHFWTSLIDTWANYNKICSFTETELRKWFIKNGRVPACINVVMGEMHKNQELQTIDKFMEIPQKTWTGWAVDITIKRPLKWSFNKVKSTFIVPTDANTKFVHVPTVRNLSEDIFKCVDNSHRNKLISLDELMSVAKLNNVELETINLVLHYLKCQDRIDVIDNPDIANNVQDKPMLIKICPQSSSKVTPINEIDISTYRLESNEKILLKLIENLEHEKAQVTKNARVYVAKGMRQMAKNCLRKQHELEKRIEKQVNVLDNVQTLITRIGTAESDTKVLESYKSGLNALKSVFKENGISEDSVSDTMLDMADTLEVHDDIQSAMSQSVVSINDAELEDELNELLNEDDRSAPPSHPSSPGGTKKDDENYDNIAERLKNLNLPPVPTETPSSSPVKNLEFS